MRKGWVTVAVLATLAGVGGSHAEEAQQKAVMTRAPSAEEREAVYPSSQEVGGQVTLRCTVTLSGALANCSVASETPSGKGLGAAALKLAPDFTYRPATRTGVPVASPVTLTIAFSEWIHVPGRLETDAVWPAAARSANVKGDVGVNCAVGSDGHLIDCKIIAERPAGRGFGTAALALASEYVHRSPASGGASAPTRITLTFSWPLDDFDTRPAWIKKPTVNEMESLWPSKANGRSGRAMLHCVVTVEGPLRDCWASDDQPAGAGFDAAALALAPSFVMKPATKNGRSVESHLNMPITWTGEGPSGGQTIKIATNLPWASAPSMADMMTAYPKDLLARKMSGHVVLRCGLRRDGRLEGCDTVRSDPNDQFAFAARTLLPKFQAIMGDVPPGLSDLRVNLAFEFAPPTSEVRYVPHATWIKTLPAAAISGAFPAKAVAAGLTTGRGTVDCLIGPGGQLTACTSVGEDPVGMDFGAMAVQLAQVMALNPWGEDGLPTEGSHIRVPLRLNREAGAPSPGTTTAP